jgi:hypothetical protein
VGALPSARSQLRCCHVRSDYHVGEAEVMLVSGVCSLSSTLMLWGERCLRKNDISLQNSF